MTTKAERIRQLLDAGMCNTMIAELVGCREEYVRTVKQRLDPAKRAKDAAAHRAIRQTCDRRVTYRAWSIHYRDARAKGMSAKEANRIGKRAMREAEYATADKAAVRAAYHAAKRGTANA